jgi:hypothetical protein
VAELSDEERSRLNRELVKLADIIETLDYEEPDYSYYQREYRKVAKQLHPEMYPKKRRKPSQKLIRTLTVCDCGNEGWKWRQIEGAVQILCPNCDRQSEAKPTNAKARDSWNETFTIQEKLL